jgi:CelD/BcsL family acetyltransferase involved in cellulose biosynthesis
MLDSFDGARVKATVLEKIPEDPEIVLAWNDLVFRMERPEVFFTHQWALAASRAFSDSLSLLTILVYESGQLLGVAAMATNRESPDRAFFLTASTADYCDIVSAPEDRAAVLEAAFEEIERRDLQDLVLANVPAESVTLQALSRVAKSRAFHVHRRRADDCALIYLGDTDERKAVLHSIMRKEKEKRGLKKLGQLGTVHVAHLNQHQWESGLQSVFVAHIARFLASNRLSPLIRPQRRAFLMELGRLLGDASWLKFSRLEVDGLPVAWNYGFRFRDSWFWYLPTFDIQHEELSPGSCLLRLLTEEACADPSVKRLDLGLGDEAYKGRFANATSPTRYVQLSKSMPRHLFHVGRNWLAASAGRFPVLERKLRTGRSLFQRLNKRTHEMGVGATVIHAIKTSMAATASEIEIAFFEAPRIDNSENQNVALRSLNWEHIALAAMQYSDDEATLQYLVRCAQRMRQGHATGYFLLGEENLISHFLWLSPYHGFYLSEIDSRLESADPKAVMIFDCWTPAAQRGRGNYATAIRLAASDLQNQQKQAWIFSAVKNVLSARGILNAGFEYRFSLLRKRRFGWSALSRRVAFDS